MGQSTMMPPPPSSSPLSPLSLKRYAIKDTTIINNISLEVPLEVAWHYPAPDGGGKEGLEWPVAVWTPSRPLPSLHDVKEFSEDVEPWMMG